METGLGSKTPLHQRLISLLMGCRIMVGSFVGLPLAQYMLFILVHVRGGKFILVHVRSVCFPNQGMSDSDCLWQNMRCGLKQLNWRNVLTMSFKRGRHHYSWLYYKNESIFKGWDNPPVPTGSVPAGVSNCDPIYARDFWKFNIHSMLTVWILLLSINFFFFP